MKKFTLIASIAICATMSQALQVSWTATNVNKGGTNLAAGTATGWLFDSNDAGATVALVTAALEAGGDTWSDFLAAHQVGNQGSSSAAGVVAGTAGDVSYTGGQSVSLFAVILDSTTRDTSEDQYYIVTSPLTKSMKSSGSTSFGFGSQASNNTWTKMEAVPEPTTVALLALGLAAVGLKRKVA